MSRKRFVGNLRDIPVGMLDEANRVLACYSVPLFALTLSQDRIVRAPYVGSGTLVSFEGAHYVVTATHVWECIQRQDAVGLSIRSESKPFWISNRLLHAVPLGSRTSDDWGPDMTFLQIPCNLVGTIQARKSFCNLDRWSEMMAQEPPAPCDGVWIVLGAAAENVDPDNETMVISAYASGIDATHHRDGLDYHDVGVNHADRSDLPRSFGGVSGAGLWHSMLERSESTGEMRWVGRFALEGVAFYERLDLEGRGIIRCHGRVSIHAGLSVLKST